ncbi:MAG: DNA internalization-related competence protein ComEC/Rec2 [Candidatus Avoscillospira sp.]
MRRLAWFAGAFALAAGLYVYLWQERCVLWIVFGSLAAAALLFLLGPSWSRLACVACLGLCAGILWCFLYGALLLPPVRDLDGTEQTVTVRVTDWPWETEYGIAMDVRLFWQGRDCGAMLYAGSMEDLPEPGDTVTCTAELHRTGTEPLSGDSLTARSGGTVVLLNASSELTVETGTVPRTARVRRWLQERLHRLYAGQAAGLLRAVLTGDRWELSYGDRNDLAVAGVSHAIAVSGMHVTMLLTLLTLLLGVRSKAAAWLGIPLVCFFAVMTGGSPSVIRAAVMEVLLLGAVLVKREYDVPTALSAAALVLLLQNPWAVASAGMQLSFAAVLGIYLFSGRVYRRLLGAERQPGLLLRTVVTALSATFGATVLTAPLCALYFGMLSLAAPLTNLLVLWAVTGVFTLGLLSCLLGPAGPILAWVVTRLSGYIFLVCRWIAAFPFAAAYGGTPLLAWGLCAYGLLLVLLLWKTLRPVIPLCLLGMALCGCLFWSRWQFVRGDLSFTALDVGQGQCLLLESQGFTAMVDCGGDGEDEAGETAARYLHSMGQTHLDVLILTHYDLDHMGGVCQLLHRVRVDRLLLPDLQSERRAVLEEAAKASGTEVLVVSEKTDVTFSAGELQVFPPDSGKNGNESGLCVLATAAEYDILITGDRSFSGEQSLLSRWALPHVDLLVAGHHGAADSTSLALLGRVTPETVVISVGENNPYGHPADSTLERLQFVGAEILRTDLQGTITIRK